MSRRRSANARPKKTKLENAGCPLPGACTALQPELLFGLGGTSAIVGLSAASCGIARVPTLPAAPAALLGLTGGLTMLTLVEPAAGAAAPAPFATEPELPPATN